MKITTAVTEQHIDDVCCRKCMKLKTAVTEPLPIMQVQVICKLNCNKNIVIKRIHLQNRY